MEKKAKVLHKNYDDHYMHRAWVMSDNKEMESTFIHERGNYQKKGAEVRPNVIGERRAIPLITSRGVGVPRVADTAAVTYRRAHRLTMPPA